MPGCGFGSETETVEPSHSFLQGSVIRKGSQGINFLLMFFSRKFNGLFFKNMK